MQSSGLSTPSSSFLSSSYSTESRNGILFSSPNDVLHKEQFIPSQERHSNKEPSPTSLQKKKFKVLNSLERAGIKQKQKELEERMKKEYTPNLEISYLKAKLQ